MWEAVGDGVQEQVGKVYWMCVLRVCGVVFAG